MSAAGKLLRGRILSALPTDLISLVRGVVAMIRRVPKPWGEEIIFAHTERYAGKVLRVRAGESLSLQYHERKDEALYLWEGRIRVHIERDGVVTDRVVDALQGGG